MPGLAHIVFFSLNDKSEPMQDALVQACEKYLNDHPGCVYFSAGKRIQDLNREVNDSDFDVALHVVFDSRQSHDDYQTAERHLRFIEEQKENWSRVRVFDSNL